MGEVLEPIDIVHIESELAQEIASAEEQFNNLRASVDQAYEAANQLRQQLETLIEKKCKLDAVNSWIAQIKQRSGGAQS